MVLLGLEAITHVNLLHLSHARFHGLTDPELLDALFNRHVCHDDTCRSSIAIVDSHQLQLSFHVSDGFRRRHVYHLRTDLCHGSTIRLALETWY